MVQYSVLKRMDRGEVPAGPGSKLSTGHGILESWVTREWSESGGHRPYAGIISWPCGLLMVWERVGPDKGQDM